MSFRNVLLLFLTLYYACIIDGRRNTQENVKIVNGFEANIQDFYYQASLRLRGGHFCGGAIISDRFILTAGHCMKPFQGHLTDLSVQVGATNVTSSTGQHITVRKTYVHPKFNGTSLDYDIALIELSEEIDVTGSARPIRVANQKRFPNGAVGVISGWGYTSEDDIDLPKNLRAVRMPLISPASCRQFYTNMLTARMICAGYVQGQKDSCQGDSGGPLVYKRELIGIVSWGIGCARPNKPGVYTNLYTVRSFITNIAGII